MSARKLVPVLLFTAVVAGCGDEGSPATPELSAAEIAEIELLADRAVAAGIPGIAVTITAGTQEVNIARGVEDMATGAPLSTQHHFRVGSVAKSLLASVMLQLVDEGKLRLADTVEQHLPGQVTGNSHATLEQVMRLQSGIFDHASDPGYLLPYLGGDFEYRYTPQQLLALSNQHAPLFPPGERFNYSNTNYVIIGLIIEKVTGQPLADVVAQRITGPLGMRETSMPLDSNLPAPFAHGYLVGMGAPIDVTRISASSTYGHGNLVSTPGDLNRFYRALVAGQVVKPAYLPLMFTPDAKIETRYGIGTWVFDDFPCGAWVGHDGATAGYNTSAYARRDGRRQITAQVTSLTADDKSGDPAAQQAWKDVIIAAGCK